MITGIGYGRVRNLQHHVNYFEDLEKEYSFFIESQKNHVIDNREYGWLPAGNWNETKEIIEKKNITAVLLSIEGAHVFNSGLVEFGKKASESEIIENIKKVKQWKFPPVFITFAHNFNNELCGHANSLEPIKAFVDQSTGINTGFTPLGKTVLHHLLSDQNGRPVFIDIKHMSLKARKEYFEIIETDYRRQRIPTLVSHGAVNGMQWNGLKTADLPDVFYPSDINFFDEEIAAIGKGGGLFAIQFDTRRIAQKNLVKKRLNSLFGKSDVKRSALLIWYQIVHITRILDKAGIFGWGTAAIGSDYDSTIDPLPGIWSAEQFPLLENELFRLASDYLNGNPPLKVMENKMITAGEVVNRFFIDNTIRFLKENC